MLQDNRNANQQERRQKTAANVNTKTILVGRGQGNCVSTILSFEPTILDANTFHTSASLKSPYPLPYVVDIQLKYNITRSTILSYLYGSYAMYHTIPDILLPFVSAAKLVAYEPFYADALPNASRACLQCNVQLKR